MSERSDADYVQDMLEAARRACGYCDGLSYDQFLADPKTQDAVARNVVVDRGGD